MNDKIEKNNESSANIRNISNAVLFNKKDSGSRSTKCPLEGEAIDYKNLKLIQDNISDRGRILSARINNISSKNYRKLKKAIKWARDIALVPYSKKD